MEWTARLLIAILVTCGTRALIFTRSRGCVDGVLGGICTIEMIAMHERVSDIEQSKQIVWKRVREGGNTATAILLRANVPDRGRVKRNIDHRSEHAGIVAVIREKTHVVINTLSMRILKKPR